MFDCFNTTRKLVDKLEDAKVVFILVSTYYKIFGEWQLHNLCHTLLQLIVEK